LTDFPRTLLEFSDGCPDCGRRVTDLPAPLPPVGDDFDWRARDYDGFRLFMLEELAARFPERQAWTPADLEVVIVEVLASVLDQLSDMNDRIFAESFLQTARRPDSVYRLLQMIGYEAAVSGQTKDEILDLWRREPFRMEAARQAGPRLIHTQKRMVTVEDYAQLLQEHPFVLHASAISEWSGSWNSIRITVHLWENQPLDYYPGADSGGIPGDSYPDELWKSVRQFHADHHLKPTYSETDTPSIRNLLERFVDSYRMVGQEVVLQDATFVGIMMSISVRIADNYFQSEVRTAIHQALGRGPDGFFEPGRLQFGEDLYISDIVQHLMKLDGIEHICLNRFKRVGNQYPNRVDAGFIAFDGIEVAVCDNSESHKERGYYLLKLHGGRSG